MSYSRSISAKCIYPIIPQYIFLFLPDMHHINCLIHNKKSVTTDLHKITATYFACWAADLINLTEVSDIRPSGSQQDYKGLMLLPCDFHTWTGCLRVLKSCNSVRTL